MTVLVVVFVDFKDIVENRIVAVKVEDEVTARVRVAITTPFGNTYVKNATSSRIAVARLIVNAYWPSMTAVNSSFTLLRSAE